MRIKTSRLTLEPLTCWQITLNNGLPVGEIHCKGVPQNGEVEIGYGISDPKYRGRGYMKEALRAFCEHIWECGDVDSVRAETAPENFASQNVLIACGFTQCGRNGRDIVWRLTRNKPRP